jgi:hypothetical protein
LNQYLKNRSSQGLSNREMLANRGMRGSIRMESTMELSIDLSLIREVS